MVTVHSDRVVGFMLGLLSSLAYGVADFAGGLAARRARVTQVVALAAPASARGTGGVDAPWGQLVRVGDLVGRRSGADVSGGVCLAVLVSGDWPDEHPFASDGGDLGGVAGHRRVRWMSGSDRVPSRG